MAIMKKKSTRGFICGMRSREDQKMKPKLWVVEKRMDGRIDGISIEERFKKLAKVYKIKFLDVDFEEHRKTLRNFF